MKKLNSQEAGTAHEDARRLEAEADPSAPHPDGTVISRRNRASRMSNLRLPEEQCAAIQEIAENQHLPMSTRGPTSDVARPDGPRVAAEFAV